MNSKALTPWVTPTSRGLLEAKTHSSLLFSTVDRGNRPPVAHVEPARQKRLITEYAPQVDRPRLHASLTPADRTHWDLVGSWPETHDDRAYVFAETLHQMAYRLENALGLTARLSKKEEMCVRPIENQEDANPDRLGERQPVSPMAARYR